MGVACCAESRRKPQIIDIKTYISLLSDTNSIVEFCLNKIVINVKRYEIIDALGIFLNGIYSYLLKTQSLLFEKESQIEQNFLNDEAIVQLKSSIEKLKEDLITQDFLFDKEARVLTGKKILNLELSFKFFQTQLEKYSPLSEHRYLKGDFQKGFDLILTKTMVSSNYLEEEIKEILSGKFKLIKLSSYFNKYYQRIKKLRIEHVKNAKRKWNISKKTIPKLIISFVIHANTVYYQVHQLGSARIVLCQFVAYVIVKGLKLDVEPVKEI